MHPIERLRWIARAEDEPAAALGSEAAWTLAELAEQEPTALLTACRRLLDRHPACGPLWWVGARLATAGDPLEAGRHAAAELCSDPTSGRVDRALRSSFTASDVIVLTAPVDLVVPALESSKPYPLRLIGSPWSLRRDMRALASVSVSGATGWTAGEEDEALDGAALLLVEVLAAGTSGALVGPGVAAAMHAAKDAGVPAWAVIGVGRALPDRLFESAAERAADVADHVALSGFALAVGPELTGEPSEVAAQVTCPPGPELLRRSI
ncbi:MAG: hypothetical protein ABSE47_07375 [Acidimicrobiales bacterium]|jgi:hypothetical protein